MIIGIPFNRLFLAFTTLDVSNSIYLILPFQISPAMFIFTVRSLSVL